MAYRYSTNAHPSFCTMTHQEFIGWHFLTQPLTSVKTSKEKVQQCCQNWREKTPRVADMKQKIIKYKTVVQTLRTTRFERRRDDLVLILLLAI